MSVLETMAEDGHENLQPPSRTSIADPGAHDLESSDSDDHFSDAQSGLENSSGASPIIPLTRVEKVDDHPSHGEVPGTDAYAMRESDARPDEIAVMSEGNKDKDIERSSTPGGHPIPTTVVEKIDPTSPSHGEVPGTSAHEKRVADAVPDLVVKSGELSQSPSIGSSSTPGDLPIPTTKVDKVNLEPSHGEIPGTKAFEVRKGDAEPDIVEEIGETAGSPTSHSDRSPIVSYAKRKSSGAGRKAATEEYEEVEDGDDDAFGDDFDDFEEGEDDAEFGDFDDGFQESEPVPPSPRPTAPTPTFPVLDFAELDSPEDIRTATEPYMNALFPPDTIDTSVLPPISTDNPIFLTTRSASLWLQLAEPPPLQPPDWIRSRIRRLFLVSLGVPVDLDEILPASKQKKLILPSLHLNPSSGSPRNSTDTRISRLKENDRNASSASLDSQGKPTRSDSKRRRGPPPVPELDLLYARQLCTITDEAMNGLTIEELKEHVQKLEAMERTAKEVLEYWTNRTDEKLGEREAFEGVVENLVKHARKTRK